MKNWFKRIKRVKDSYELYADQCGYRKTFIAKIMDYIFIFIIISIPIFILLRLYLSLPILTAIIVYGYMSFKRNYFKLKKSAYKIIRVGEIEKQLNAMTIDDFKLLLLGILQENNIVSAVTTKENITEGIAQDMKY